MIIENYGIIYGAIFGATNDIYFIVSTVFNGVGGILLVRPEAPFAHSSTLNCLFLRVFSLTELHSRSYGRSKPNSHVH